MHNSVTFANNIMTFDFPHVQFTNEQTIINLLPEQVYIVADIISGDVPVVFYRHTVIRKDVNKRYDAIIPYYVSSGNSIVINPVPYDGEHFIPCNVIGRQFVLANTNRTKKAFGDVNQLRANMIFPIISDNKKEPVQNVTFDIFIKWIEEQFVQDMTRRGFDGIKELARLKNTQGITTVLSSIDNSLDFVLSILSSNVWQFNNTNSMSFKPINKKNVD